MIPAPKDLIKIALKVLPSQAVRHANESPLHSSIHRFDSVDMRPGLPIGILALVVLHGEMARERRSDLPVA